MKYSEKAAVIALHHSMMISQGKRNDISEHKKMLENPHEYRNDETSTQVGSKLKTKEKIDEAYNLSKKTAAQFFKPKFVLYIFQD